MKYVKHIFLLLLGFALFATVTSCKDDNDEPSNSIVGTWRYSRGDWYCQYYFKANGYFEAKDWSSGYPEPTQYDGYGTYTIIDNLLVINHIDDDGSSYTEEHYFDVNEDALIIYDYEEDGPNVFWRIK